MSKYVNIRGVIPQHDGTTGVLLFFRESTCGLLG